MDLSDGSRLGSDYVLLAAGAGTPHIGGLEAAGLPEIRPVKGHILRLGPAGRAVRAARRYSPAPCEPWCTDGPSTSSPGPTGRWWSGPPWRSAGDDLTVRAGAVHELLSDARAVVPGIDELELLEARTGLRPATPDNTPVVGWTALPGVAVASGHFRNGMLLAPLTAATVVDLFGPGMVRRRGVRAMNDLVVSVNGDPMARARRAA